MSTRFGALGNLMKKQDLILNGVCLLFAAGFLLMALSNVRWAGNFFSIDSLFITLVSLILAGIFAVIPLYWAYENGMLRDFFAAEDETTLAAAQSAPVHFEGTTKLFLSILGFLLLLTMIEVVLAYIQVPLAIMLTILVGLSLIKAALILAYFMHLRYERMSLVYTLIPMLVMCICLLFIFFPDSMRLLNSRIYR
ncbi:MAG TPA: cytochrome C oxidase subunit IV family protein [Pyrinomonadaceae bacterium]|jgi:cytochrome c oxidase subunit 4|nr:cytochrome C oxidase subunit IV family protein [Pyrinomonadaceae bacterium]